jgi:hypothetical protein
MAPYLQVHEESAAAPPITKSKTQNVLAPLHLHVRKESKAKL